MIINTLKNISLGATFLGVSLVIAGCTGGNQRFEANDPNRVSPNEFFQAHDRAMAEPVSSDGLAVTVETARGTYDTNQLAEKMMQTWEAYQSTIIQRDVVLMLNVMGRGSGGRSATNQNDDRSGQSTVIAVSEDIKAFWAGFRLMTHVRHERGPSAQIAGAYDVETKGTCPFGAGPIEVTQRDFVVQGTRRAKVVLWGALGSDRLYVVANEQRYGSTGANPATGGSALNVPDKVSELFTGTIDSKAMTLAGKMHRECTFALTRKV
jgi:hypothetical protein